LVVIVSSFTGVVEKHFKYFWRENYPYFRITVSNMLNYAANPECSI
jgi:hypothetical protein